MSGEAEDVTQALERWDVITEVTLWPLCAVVCGCLLKSYPQISHSADRLVWALQLCQGGGVAPSIAFHPSMHLSQLAKPDIRPHLFVSTCSVGAWVMTLLPQRL